jgi:hypothetical protein
MNTKAKRILQNQLRGCRKNFEKSSDLYNLGKDEAADVDRSLTALKAFAAILASKLLGAHASMEDTEGAKAPTNYGEKTGT